ncbi:MAG: molybdopterin-synthase adenylyltransferase MoeB [Gammaproteobacteria bacterium]|nr:molybdopterin-synthase adenylyltransferase MoeB [Gammaproteobacteria bacterium]
MDNDELRRYSRHILLPDIGTDGQQRLLDSTVLIIGVGGLGSPVAMYLAAAGVGRLVLVDPDVVELSNLQRQIIHGTPDLERPKVLSARDRLALLNPGVRVETHSRRFYTESGAQLVADCDVVVDACDNFTTRFVANAECFSQRKPLVSAAASRFEAQISVFRPGVDDSPCYRCLYDDTGAEGQSCDAVGVAAPLLGIAGSIQALEVLKLLVGIGEPLSGRLLFIDGLAMELRTLRVRRNPGCPVCAVSA